MLYNLWILFPIMRFIFLIHVNLFICTSCATPWNLQYVSYSSQIALIVNIDDLVRNQVQDDQSPDDDGDILASGSLIDNQQPGNPGAQNEATVPIEQTQGDLFSHNSENGLEGETVAYQQSIDELSAGNEGTLSTNYPFDTIHLPTEKSVVTDSSNMVSVPTGPCDTDNQEKIQSREEIPVCGVEQPNAMEQGQTSGSDGGTSSTPQDHNSQQQAEDHKHPSEKWPTDKFPKYGPGFIGRSNACAKYTLGYLPIGVCASPLPGNRQVSKFEWRRLPFWDLKDVTLGMI